MKKDLSRISRICRSRLSRIGLAFFVFFAVTFTLQGALVTAVAILAPSWMSSPLFAWLQSFAVMYGAAFPLFYLILKPLPTRRCGGRSISGLDLTILFFISFAAMYVMNIVGTGINLLTDAILGRSSSADATTMITESPLYLIIFFAVILGPILEEVMFRKILLSRLLPFGERFAILVGAIFFALYHGNLSQFLYAFLVALIFGVIVCRTGKIRYTILLHMLINFFGSIPPTILTRRTEALGIDGMDEAALMANPEALITMLLASFYSLLLLAAVAIGIFLLVRYAKRMIPRPTEHPIPKGERRYLALSVGCFLYAAITLFLFATSYL